MFLLKSVFSMLYDFSFSYDTGVSMLSCIIYLFCLFDYTDVISGALWHRVGQTQFLLVAFFRLSCYLSSFPW